MIPHITAPFNEATMYLICYIGSGNALVLLETHSSEEEALAALKVRDFTNSSLANKPFYLIEAALVTPSNKV